MGVLSDRQIQGLCQSSKPMISPYAEGVKRPGVISYGQTSYGYDVRLGYTFKVFTPAKLTNAVIDPKNFDPEALVHVDLTPPWLKDYGPWKTEEEWEQADLAGYTPKVKIPPNHIIIPPHSFVLGESVETFDIPRDVLVVVVGKSTYARCALVVNVTPGEPEWKGKWTIELSNTAPMPLKVYCGEGIMQCLFFRSDELRQVLETTTQLTADRVSRGMPINVAASHAYDLIRAAHNPRNASCGVSYLDKKGKYQDQAGLTLPSVDKKETN